MISIEEKINEIKKFDIGLSNKNSKEIEKSLENNSIYLITRLDNRKPTAVYIKFNGFSEVFKYKNFQKYFPNLSNYRNTKK